MLDSVNRELISFLFKASIPKQLPVKDATKLERPKKENINLSKEEVLNTDEIARRNRAAAQGTAPSPVKAQTIVRQQPKIGRNDRVVIINRISGEEKETKYKQA